MSDRFTEVTTEGYGGRLGGSLMAALFGLLLVPAGIVLLYWNEGRAVTASTALRHGASSVVEVNASAVDPHADGKLVHAVGMMRAAVGARDPELGVTADGLLRLSRTAEMYQWKQDSHSQSEQSLGGTKTTQTVYTYTQAWSGQQLDSSQFKEPDGHRNPPMQVRSGTFDGGTVTLGAYRVDPSLLAKVADFTPLQPQTAPPADYKAAGDAFYRGANPDQPVIGDVRVTFTGVQAQTMSVAAAQQGGTLTAYRDANGYSIALAEPGAVPASALFQDAAKAQGMLTWGLRGGGFLAVLIGFVCLTRPLTMVFAVVPFLESFVGAGAFLLALTLAVPVTLLVIGIAWFAHRPLIGGGLLVVGVVALVGLKRLHPRRVVR